MNTVESLMLNRGVACSHRRPTHTLTEQRSLKQIESSMLEFNDRIILSRIDPLARTTVDQRISTTRQSRACTFAFLAAPTQHDQQSHASMRARSLSIQRYDLVMKRHRRHGERERGNGSDRRPSLTHVH